MCEQFGCTPLEAWRQPLPMLLDVLEARSFAKAHAEVHAYEPAEGVSEPTGAMIDEVQAMIAEDFAKRKEERGT